MMPLALLAGFALLGWGLFCWRLYRDGKKKCEMKSLQAENASLLATLDEERRIAREQAELYAGRPDADAINGALDRLRGKGPDSR